MNQLENIQLEGILLLALIGIVVVFVALRILVIAFRTFGNFSKRTFRLRLKKEAERDQLPIEEKDLISGQEVAAISMALHLFLSDEHDEESNIITIKRIERRYSPWNSKIYGLTNLIR